jgi:ERCC4-type nuclease
MTLSHVIIDKGREEPGRESPRRKQFLLEFGVPFIEQRLEVGDYLLGEYPIEYKSWGDLYGSILSGRVYEQAFNLQQYKSPMIAVVGDKFRELNELRKFRKYGRGKTFHRDPEEIIRTGLATLYKSFNVSIVMFDSDRDFCLFVAAMYKLLNKEPSKYRPIFHKRKAGDINNPKELKKIQENVLCEIPKISVGKAQAILKPNRYSLKRVINNPDRLREIKGIGDVIIENMKKVFR